MPLSEHEQRLLEQMERALYAEDPKFASSLRSAGPRPGSRRKAAVGVLTALVGFGLLITFAVAPVDLRGSWVIVPIGQALVAIPLVVRTVLPVLRSLDPRLRGAEIRAEHQLTPELALDASTASLLVLFAGLAVLLAGCSAPSSSSSPAPPTPSSSTSSAATSRPSARAMATRSVT